MQLLGTLSAVLVATVLGILRTATVNQTVNYLVTAAMTSKLFAVSGMSEFYTKLITPPKVTLSTSYEL